MWFVLAGGVAFAAGIVTGWLAARSVLERARFDAQIAAFEKQIESNRAPKHAARTPRDVGGAIARHAEDGAATGVQRSTDRSPRVGNRLPPAHPRRLARDPGGPWYWRHPSPGTPPPAAVTAADIAPVFYTEPGTRIPVHPQPARDSGDGTITMGKITDTGELRAITERADAIIAGFTTGQDGAV